MNRMRNRATAAGWALAVVVALSACRPVAVEPPAAAPDEPPVVRSPAELEQVFAAAIEQLVRSGGDTVRLDRFDATDEHVAVLANIERLRVVRIDGGKLTVAAAEHFAAMPHLEQLHLRNVALDDAFIEALVASRSLWLLNVAAAEISPAAVERLAEMPQLRQLRLAVPGGDNGFAAAVAAIRTLRSVHLIGIAVTDAGLQELATLPQLQSLYLDDTEISDQGWVWLFENRPGLHVHIDQKHHDRDPQRH